MIRWRKSRIVAWFEFWTTVKRKGYLISTFGMPLFLLLYAAIAAIPGYFASEGEKNDVRRVGVVDESGVIRMDSTLEVDLFEMPEEAQRAIDMAAAASKQSEALLKMGTVEFVLYNSLDEVKEAVLSEELRAAYHVLPDYLETGSVEVYRRDGGIRESNTGGEQFRQLLRKSLVAERLPDNVRERLDDTLPQRKDWVLAKDGTVSELNIGAMIAKFLVPGIFAMLLFVSLMMTSGYLLQATATEKENKVVEVILSAADPDEILLGKLLGLGAAGLLQILIWFSMLIVGAIVAAGILVAFGIAVPWKLIVISFPYFVLTYFFLGSLILATGSIGGNLKESQQLSLPWTLLPAVPFMFMGLLIQNPSGTLSKVLSVIPFTSAITVMARLILDPSGLATWEILLGLIVLLLSTWLAISLGARLFRVGLLMTGTRPKLREIVRQARLGS